VLVHHHSRNDSFPLSNYVIIRYGAPFPLMRRLSQFLRSIIPADLWQLVFLLGVVFVFISPRLPWWPSTLIESSGPASRLLQSEAGRFELRGFLVACLYPIMFAGVAGCFVCFWPGRRPVLRIFWAVCLPTALSLVLILRKFFQITQATPSVFDPHLNLVFVIRWFQLNALKFSPGVYFSAAGLLLILVFTIRLALRKTSLQFTLSNERASGDDRGDPWSQMRLLVFVLVGPYFLVGGLFTLLLLFVPALVSLPLSPTYWSVTARITPVLEGGVLVGVSLWILGKRGRTAARDALQLPELRFALVALILAVAISGLIPGAQYLIDRAQWAAYDFGRFEPPQLSSYFDLANSWQPWLLLITFVGFGEEIVFRGLMLPSLIRRYGLHRGIFLTGIIWATIHFRSDSYPGLSVGGVLLHLANRLLLCLALNYVFAWMTLRWKSIIPAAIAHTAWNILAAMQVDSNGLWNWELGFALWAVLAYVLFRFWPPAAGETLQDVQPDASPEPAA
jgi:membrane protease YdiL (CAAX protease family)